MNLVVVFFIMLFAADASAAYFYKNPMDTTTEYPSASSACEAYLKAYNPSVNKSFTRWANADGVDPNSSGSGFCYYKSIKPDGSFGSETRASSTVRRYGALAVCTADSVPSAIVSRGSNGPVVTSQAGEKYVISASPDSVCSGICMYEKPEKQRTQNCYLVTGDHTTGFCNYAFTLVTDEKGEGTQCSIKTSVDAETADQLNPEPVDPCVDDPQAQGCSTGGGTGGGSTGDDTGGQDGDEPGDDNGSGDEGDDAGTEGPDAGSGDDNSGDGNQGSGEGGTGSGNGSGSGGSGSGGGSSGSGGDGSGSGTGDGSNGDGSSGQNPVFTSPGALDLNVDSERRAAEAKAKYSGFKQELDNSQTFRAINQSFGGSNPHSNVACPVGSVELFGRDIRFDSHCDLFASIKSILSAVFIAIWSLLAVRIVLSA